MTILQSYFSVPAILLAGAGFVLFLRYHVDQARGSASFQRGESPVLISHFEVEVL